jgi:PadR family transcriptional regulator, regulatory protein PadR
MRFQRELLKGTTEVLVLAALQEAPSHGYDLIQRLRERSQGIFELGEGTLYPLLYKLEAKGWIAGKWESNGTDRRRRVYRISPKGKQQLGQRAGEWQALVQGMSLILGGLAHA